MAGLFVIFVTTVALANMLSDYVNSANDSDDSDPSPVIVFTPEDDTTDWQNDGE